MSNEFAPGEFHSGFFVRDPFWHKLGNVIDDFPEDIDEGMELAGHDFEVTEHEIATLAPVGVLAVGDADWTPETDGLAIVPDWEKVQGWKALRKGEDGPLLNVVRSSYEVIQNRVGWELVYAIVGAGAKIETAITLKEGALCSVLAWLDEPVHIPGDEQLIFPYLNVSWAHDGSASLSGRSTNIRTGCWNTQSAAELLGKRVGVEFNFRHTKNVLDRVDEAKAAISGTRKGHQEYVELATELATLPVTTRQREIFVQEFIPTPPDAIISDRVKRNIEDARTGLRSLFDGPTIPEAHKLTAYGLQLAGVEFLDHLRGYRTQDTLYGRSLLRNEPAKGKLVKLARECALA
jgi:phage/plasmid-like protein (TIGR03299 family)